MFKSTRLITLAKGAPPGDLDDVIPSLEALGREFAVASLVQPTLDGVFNGGDIIAHYQFADEVSHHALEAEMGARLPPALIEHVDSVAYQRIEGDVADPALDSGIYRTLLLCADRSDDRRTIERFEAEMAMMPHYITAIRNWQLSRVRSSAGALPWTHVWEQEFEDLGGLMGAYTLHPYHWGAIDRWYDPECPDWLVNVRLCHSFCALDRSII